MNLNLFYSNCCAIIHMRMYMFLTRVTFLFIYCLFYSYNFPSFGMCELFPHLF